MRIVGWFGLGIILLVLDDSDDVGMEDRIGDDLQIGLDNLKQLLEK